MQRVLVGNDATTRTTFYSGDTPADATGDVTVTVTRDDGTVLAGGTATNASTGVYEFDLADATHTSRLDVLTVTWAGLIAGSTQVKTTQVEVVGGFYVELGEIRSLPKLGDSGKFPLEALEDARNWFETLAEEHCGVAFVPRYARDLVDGNDRYELLLNRLYPRSLIGVTVDGVTTSTTGWQLYPSGRLSRDHLGSFAVPTSTTIGRNIAVSYTHGYDRPPADLRDVALLAIRDKLLADREGREAGRVLSQTNEFGGTTRFALPGSDRPTGIPDVDTVLNRYVERVPVIG